MLHVNFFTIDRYISDIKIYSFHNYRFMDSELDLNDEIQKLHVIATVPHLYQHIVDVNAVGTILGLLSHENSGNKIVVV